MNATEMSSSREVNYNKHHIQTTKFRPSSQMNAGALPKILKILVDDLDGTDSSSHEGEGHISHPSNVRKVINEIRIEPLSYGEKVILNRMERTKLLVEM